LRQFDLALAPLTEVDDVDRAVHGARKAMKRLRALLRLVRPVIGNRRYRAENAYLRDTARVLSPLRDARVMVDTVGLIRDRYDSQLRPTAFDGVESQLRARLERTRASMVHDGGALRRTAYSLRSARARYAAWPVADDVVSGSHPPIPNRFESVGVGLEMIYARGRDEMRTAIEHPTAHNFHWWRKRAKYLRYHSELLFPMWPDMMKGQVQALDHLGEALGAEHDLAQLLLVLVQHPEVCPDPTERALLVALAQHRRRELQAAAVTMGIRVYAEKPADFGKRMGVYWDAWMEERAAGIAIDPA
jgi:CHAD domain-containing protein